jgi:hypothetical protein
MSRIFFVRDGGGVHKTDQGTEVAFATVSEKLAKRSTKFFAPDKIPVINSGEASAYAEFRHIVVEIHDGEISETFPKPGRYYIQALSPKECEDLFGITPR